MDRGQQELPSENMPSQSTFRPDIQGLRALAVVLVLMAHFDVPPFTGGFVGVDVFFVISGFLITGILWRELEKEGRICLARFYARRLKRLFPALAVVVLASLAVGAVAISSIELRTQSASLPYALSWTSNLYFAFRDIDYFSWLQDFDLYLHTWSLGVEEQFYLLWPLLLLLIYRRVASRSGALTAIALVSLGTCLWISTIKPQWAFYLPMFRIWEFALGGFVFWHQGRIAVMSPRTRQGLGLVGLGLIVGAGLGYDATLTYPGGWATTPALGAALLMAGGPELGRLMSHRSLVWIGDRSYSLYLWHWPIFVLGSAWHIPDHVSGKAGLVGLAVLLSMATYRWVELPFWKGNLGSRWRPREVFAGTAVAMLAFISAGMVGLNAVIDSGQGTQDKLERIRVAQVDFPLIYGYGCDSWYREAKLVPCALGPKHPKGTLVLVGDSVSAQWSSMLALAYPEHRLVVLTKSSCPMVDEPYYYPRIKRVYENCTLWRRKALDYIAQLKPEAVFVGSASTYPYTPSQWREGSARVWRELAQSAGQVHVIAGTLNLGVDGPGCLSRHIEALEKASVECTKRWSGKESVPQVNALLKQVAGKLPRVDVLDLNDQVCPGGQCRALTDKGVIVFRDSQHLTDTFALSLAPVVRERLGVTDKIDRDAIVGLTSGNRSSAAL